jgi:hypothetical protein
MYLERSHNIVEFRSDLIVGDARNSYFILGLRPAKYVLVGLTKFLG